MKFLIDVDYPYSSRWKSFLSVFTGVKFGNDYLQNSKIIARMINRSGLPVSAFWSFTYQAVPDQELTYLLRNNGHAVALHLVKDPERELAILEEAVKRKVSLYSVHGISNRGKLIWKTVLRRNTIIENMERLVYTTSPEVFHLDVYCFNHNFEASLQKCKEAVLQEKFIHFHPEWLFQKGTLNHRSSFYLVLYNLLEESKSEN